MRIAIAQINSSVGDFPANRKKILDFAWKAKNEEQADLILFPELSLCGAPPLDLLEQDLFTECNAASIRLLEELLPEDCAIGLGYVKRSPWSEPAKLLNVYGIIQNRELIFEQEKIIPQRYDYFDECRYFDAGRKVKVFEFLGERIGIAINGDALHEHHGPEQTDPVGKALEQGISLLCVPQASPYYAAGFRDRLKKMRHICDTGKIPVLSINASGANDSVIFDGRSFALAPAGSSRSADRITGSAVNCAAKAFEEDLVIWDLSETSRLREAPLSENDLDEMEEALVLGIRDYMRKCGFTGIHLGLSGGIDSALVAYLAVRAAGPKNVVCFNMPSQFSSRGSRDDSKKLAENLGCRYEIIPIEPIYNVFLSSLKGVFENRPFDVAEENLQARIRGTLWMAYANKFNSMLLAAGNKSELAMGYCTLYGDTNGALAPIGDMFKTEVFAMCRRINERAAAAGRAAIPEAIIDKPPSAELRPNQKDQDSLPPYETLDEILRLYLYENLSPGEITDRGWDREIVNRIIRSVARTEWKRRQTPPVLKISRRAFGIGRIMPLARGIFEA